MISMPLISIITEERLHKYLVASGFDKTRAVVLYGWNIEISGAFYPLLSAAEVSLRNIISARLVALYGLEWWTDADFLHEIKKEGRRIIKTASGKLAKTGPVTSGRMVAELNFGFWVNMLLPRHQPVFWADFPASFPDLPATVTYDALFNRCDAVRSFRNRIFHHEPIVGRDISSEAALLLELVRWLSPSKADWIKPYSRVQAVLRTKP